MARRGSRGKGGGTRAAVEQKVQQGLTQNTDELNKLDPKYSAESDRITGALEASRGKLATLDDETKAGLDARRKAEEALQERQFAQQRDRLLTRLFGQGRTEGSLAGQMGGQLIGDQQLVMQQIAAADASNRMNARMGLTQANLQNLGLQGQTLNQSRAAALQQMGIASSERMNALNAATGALNAYTGADAQMASARIGANAQIQSTQISADASMANARMAAAASRYGSDRSLDATRVSAAAGVRSAQIGAAASRFNALKSLEASKFGDTSRLFGQIYGIDTQNQQFGQDLAYRREALASQEALGYAGLQNNLDVAELQGKYQLKGIDAQKPSTTDKLIGMAGGLLSVFSDGDLKYDVHPVDHALEKIEKIHGVMFKWKDDHRPSGGVIAQEVEAVLPEAVARGRDGRRRVDYGAVIALLIEAVRELADERKVH